MTIGHDIDIPSRRGVGELRTVSSLRGRIVALVVIATIGSALMVGGSYSAWNEELALSNADTELSNEVKLLRPYVEAAYDRLADDALFLASTPPIRGLERAIANDGVDPFDGSTETLWRTRLETIFKSLMERRSPYVQIRYVGVADGGRELVRVDAPFMHEVRGGAVRVPTETPVDALQRKGTRSYLREARSLRPGEIYFSEISPNLEHGRVVEGQVVVRAVAAVHNENGLYGWIVINADATETFTQQIGDIDLPDGHHGYVVTDSGLAFENEGGGDWVESSREDSPILDSIFRDYRLHVGTPGEVFLSEMQHRHVAQVSIEIPSHFEDRSLGLAISRSNEEIFGAMSALRRRSLVVGVALLVLCGLVAVFIARALTRPLGEMARAIEAYDGEPGGLALPVERTDEIGVLARSFESLTTELVESRAEIEAAGARVLAIFEKSVDGFVTTDEMGIITAFNSACEEMFGWSRDEIIGKNISNLIPEPHRSQHDGYLEKYRLDPDRKMPQLRELVGCHRDGREFPVDVTVSEIEASGHVYYNAIVKDIRVRKAQEAELQRYMREIERARDAAAAANASKSEFLANMSHEIRTPMTSILGYSEILREGRATDDECKQYLETIHRNGHHLLSIINDILDVSKIEAGRMTVESIDCSPRVIVSQVAELLKERAEGQGIELRTVQRGPVPTTIRTDPTRLRQILLNLAGNAIKFTPEGSVSIAYGCTLGVDPEFWFEIIDTGIGISEEQRSGLFQSFAQADTSTARKYGGTGLGLTISKRLSVMLGGDIELDSTPGEGSTFRVTIDPGDLSEIPVVGEGETPAGVKAPVEDDADPDLTGVRILLAEDGPDNQRLFRFHLERAGADLRIVEDGRAAVESALSRQAKDEPYDIVLMDMQMPVMDGYSATTALRETGFETPIIALTAHAMEHERERCIAAGASDFATKPIDRKSLLRVVDAWARVREQT